MKNCAGVIVSIVALALSAAGCAKPTAKGPPAPPPPALKKITFNYPIPKDCPVGTTPDASENYKITLGPNFKLTDPDVTKGGHPEGKLNGSLPHPSKLDVITNLLQVSQAGTVTIVLSQKLDFASPELAFNGGDENAPKIFCNPQFGTTPTGDPMLTFTVLANPSVRYASYILGLVAHDQNPHSSDSLPVFFDPGVDNDGFQEKK